MGLPPEFCSARFAAARYLNNRKSATEVTEKNKTHGNGQGGYLTNNPSPYNVTAHTVHIRFFISSVP
jgi:hypothetical protein